MYGVTGWDFSLRAPRPVRIGCNQNSIMPWSGAETRIKNDLHVTRRLCVALVKSRNEMMNFDDQLTLYLPCVGVVSARLVLNYDVTTWKPFPHYWPFVGPIHDDVIKWKHFPRYWPFVRGIHRSPVNSPHKGQWRGALMFSLICGWINGWVNNREAGDLRRYRGHSDVTVMLWSFMVFSVSLDELLAKQWSCCWFETLWRSCVVTIMG